MKRDQYSRGPQGAEQGRLNGPASQPDRRNPCRLAESDHPITSSSPIVLAPLRN
jgi:hypothetical protein